MKKLLLISVVFIFFNCEDEVSNKIPGFEATINGNFDWVADSYVATLQNNQLSITGTSPFGTIAMQIDTLELGSYNLYSWTDDFAIFQDIYRLFLSESLLRRSSKMVFLFYRVFEVLFLLT